MEILLVTQEYPPYGSGIANAVYRLRQQIVKEGVGVDILCPEEADISAASLFLRLGGLGGKIPFWQQIGRCIAKKACEYDAVWLHSPLMLSAKKLGEAKKLMVTFHSTYFGFFRAFRTHGISRLTPYYCLASNIESHFFRELSSFHNTIVTAVSPSVADEAHRNGFLHIPHVVSNGIARESFTAVDKHKAHLLLRDEFSLRPPEKGLVLLYSGRVTEVKQPLLLVDLIGAISSVRQDVYLLIAGSGNLLSKSMKRAARWQNLHFLGQIPHEKMPLLLSAADVFISLSCYEGLPLSVLESARFGIPLILSDIPAHRWIIEQRIGHGILVDSHRPNPNRILEFLERVERRQVIPVANSLDRFSWKSAADHYLKLLKQ
jgi:glycosyltransferase involved in cell wall biosynthesis